MLVFLQSPSSYHLTFRILLHDLLKQVKQIEARSSPKERLSDAVVATAIDDAADVMRSGAIELWSPLSSDVSIYHDGFVWGS